MELDLIAHYVGFGSFKGMVLYFLFLISFALIGYMIYSSQKVK